MEEVPHETLPNQWVRKPPRDTSSFFRIAPEIQNYADVELVKIEVESVNGEKNFLNKDSTDINPIDWTLIAKAIFERKDKFHGFVVAHGTDTMHFTASAIAFAFGQNLNFPIVFTGAQTTAFVPHGDARINLIRAVRVAIENYAEVSICFGDYVFRGCRTQKKDEKKFDAFESPAFFPLADITEEIIWHPLAKKIVPKEEEVELDFRPEFELGLVQFSLIPGLLPKQFMPLLDASEIKGVILQSFGAGNVPFEGEFSFEPFIKKAVERNIPVIIASQFPANSTLHSIYEPGMKAREAGAIPTGNMTNAAATAKFRWVLSQTLSDIRQGNLDQSKKIARVTEKMTQVYVNEMDDALTKQRIMEA